MFSSLEKIGAAMVLVFLVVPAIILIVSIPFVLASVKDQEDRADQLAASMGCENLGSARYVESVKFFDCGGEIKLVRVR